MKHWLLNARSTVLLGVLALAPAVVAAGPSDARVAEARQPDPVRGAVTDHVIVVSIDGLRPDAIEEYGLGTLQLLAREGSHTFEAQTILPSKTLPSHTSMITGVTPSVHGVTWNSDEMETRGHVEVPTMFELAKRGGFATAAFFSKTKFHHLQVPGSLDYTQAPAGIEHWMATRTIGDVVTYLEHERPNLLFVHIAEPDYAGHSVGWMSFMYGWATRRADSGVETLIEAADRAFGRGEYTLIVTADHGGHGRDHGTDDPRDTTIPWIVWGEGVAAGQELPAGVRTMDTAATVLWLLGLAEPPVWEGSPVATAFAPSARLAAAAARGGLMQQAGMADGPAVPTDSTL